jgi:hypothetical protein
MPMQSSVAELEVHRSSAPDRRDGHLGNVTCGNAPVIGAAGICTGG